MRRLLDRKYRASKMWIGYYAPEICTFRLNSHVYLRTRNSPVIVLKLHCFRRRLGGA